MIKPAWVVIFFLIFSGNGFAGQLIEVKDDSNNGVSSSIYFEDVNNFIGDTDPSGKLVTGDNCRKNKMVIAKPKSPLYESGKKMCVSTDKKMLVRVTWKPVYTNLTHNLNVLIAQKQYGAAALASNEIAARSVSEKSSEMKVKTIELFAKHIQFPDVSKAVAYDPEQKQKVPTFEMIDAVKTFQAKNGLPVSGLIDYRTLSAAAGLNSGSILFRQIQ